MAPNQPSYLARLWNALLARDSAAPTAGNSAQAPPTASVADLPVDAATLRLELHERNQTIDQMRREYAQLQAQTERAATTASGDQLERLFKKLAGPLANLQALSALVDAGQQVAPGDLVALLHTLNKELARAGLEPIGRVGDKVPFDVAAHQRMSGGAVHGGVPVTVRLPGYRMGEKVLAKALVSAAPDQPSEES